ncbi:FAD-binding oxidoreductase [Janibacter cremeus]|uniref:Alkyldihydroxyacetonephosphate synthase n=1 Tax=Janibacter cremeus TaxID=1285192 RepID=A0A852VQM7_9MICO|nr:FAD-binding oxidoreductase [Janibacter cremeus]NYF98516.1 alkyldihydroxyacetonephosphate synthase [Janibacter cremeus]
MADLTELPRRSIWYGWGDPAHVKPLPTGGWPLLKFLGRVEPAARDTPPVALEDVRLPEVHLSDAARAQLVAVVGDEHFSTARLDRVEHTGGKSYPDLYRLRTGDGSRAPDAVVFPGTSQQVCDLLAACVEHEVAVVPFGGGTSVVGGVDPVRGRFSAVISLDLRRLDAVVSVDSLSQTAVVQAGARGPAAEAVFQRHGLTLGHFPQSYQQATIGGYLVTRSAGQASSGYGRFEENVVSVTMATPTGELVLGGRAPANQSAAGPKLLDVVIGSEGLLGVVTEATVQLARRPQIEHRETWALRDTATGFAAFRDLAQQLGHGIMPDVSRLSDHNETTTVMAQAGLPGMAGMGLVRARGWREPALAVFQIEDGDRASLRFRRKKLASVLKRHGAVKLTDSIAEHWMAGRFRGPYQRDHLMDRGVLVETVETATTWDNLEHLYESVQSAIVETMGRGWVQCHVSHLDGGGASLYYTFMASAESDPIAQWQRVKTAAGDAMIGAGGTITHHHAVGTDHRPWIGEEIGDGGIRILRAIKAELDPTGVLNPGKLIPDEGA